jgi:hypothetical protein
VVAARFELALTERIEGLLCIVTIGDQVPVRMCAHGQIRTDATRRSRAIGRLGTAECGRAGRLHGSATVEMNESGRCITMAIEIPSLDEAITRLRALLRSEGSHRRDIRWLGRSDVVLLDRSLLVGDPLPADRPALVQARYSQAAMDQGGVGLHAVGSDVDAVYCILCVPGSSAEAEDQWISGLTLRVLQPLHPIEFVGSSAWQNRLKRQTNEQVSYLNDLFGCLHRGQP